MLVDVQMEAEGWGREQRAGALAGLSVTSAQSLMQVRGRRSTEAESSRRALLPLRPPPPATPPPMPQDRNRKLASEVSSLKRELAEQAESLLKV